MSKKTSKSTMKDRATVVIVGAAGNIGQTLTSALSDTYEVVGFDRPGAKGDIEMDITSEQSIEYALEKFENKFGKNIAAVVHLAAYFDFSDEPSPLYEKINVEGTRNLLKGLQSFNVERFIYSSTMLVHQAGSPGEQINEQTPVAPKWAYPESKAATESVIKECAQDIPYTILRLAGFYDDESAVPTLAHQIANIYERDLMSILHAGDIHAGQAFIHRDDMIALFEKTIAKRKELPKQCEILAGETENLSYRDLQHVIGQLIHGEKDWKTLSLPSGVAKAGAWFEQKAEQVIPDDFDEGEKPFIKPFMIDLASDHYDLDISCAQSLLDWTPKHNIQSELPKLIENLKANPIEWYRRNGVAVPPWMRAASEKNANPDRIRNDYETQYQQQHWKSIWSHFMVVGLGAWLAFSPFTLGYESTGMMVSDVVCGLLLVLLGSLSLSPHPSNRKARWLVGGLGLWLMFAPLVFWAPTAAAYLNGTLVGTLVTCFAMVVRPFPSLSPVAAATGPEVPPGWDFSPSDWFQRIPIIFLAFIGFFISRYLTAYQLGHIDAVWDPFFSGAEIAGEKNGTEEIITSSVSKAWPVPDAGLGALTYLLEIITGLIGSRARWRTMPWLVLLFGFMIIPLGAISITFIIIQPIVLNSWCTLCLIAAAAMLLQIPYSFDEIVATIQFLRRRAQKGHPWMRIMFTGDTDDGPKSKSTGDDFSQPPLAILKSMIQGGVTAPWNLLACCAIGIWLMFSQITVGSAGAMANSDHLIGALVLTVTVTAFAEVTRPLRYLNVFLGLALLIAPFVLANNLLAMIASILCGILLIGLSLPRGHIETHYGEWNKALY